MGRTPLIFVPIVFSMVPTTAQRKYDSSDVSDTEQLLKDELDTDLFAPFSSDPCAGSDKKVLSQLSQLNHIFSFYPISLRIRRNCRSRRTLLDKYSRHETRGDIRPTC